ncbi:MAG: thioredoxin fold domain-containing protein [candidate division NC10 bacterium]|nr:thioredoxin fold domain-containing protein [candidate division NC10 bacterium]
MNDSRRLGWSWIRMGALSMAVAMGLFLAGSPACAASKTTGGVKWYGYEEGMREARESHRPVLLHFYTDWCPWCKKMERDTFSHPQIQEALNQGFVSIRINPESKEKIRVEGREVKAADLARKFEVRGFPTTIFLESDGSPIGPVPGYIDSDSMRKILAYVQEKAYQKMTFDEYARQRS